MALFQRKRTVTEAQQYHGPSNPPKGVFFEGLAPYVITVHGQRVYIDLGDWIIPEKDGVHYYPCKPDIFDETYEPIVEENEKSVPGFWTSKACAYSDSRGRCPVLAATPNNGDAARKGFIHYLTLKDNQAHLQIGAVIPSDRARHVKHARIPDEVAERAILAAMEIVIGWHYCHEPKDFKAQPDALPDSIG